MDIYENGVEKHTITISSANLEGYVSVLHYCLSGKLDYHVDSMPSQPAQCECHLVPSWRVPIMSKGGIGDLDV